MCSGREARLGFGLLFIVCLVIFSSGCEDKKEGIALKAGEQHSVEFEGKTGDVLSINWEASGSIMWQLIDDNSTKVPGNPQHIIGYELKGENSIEIHQNATYELVFENIGTKEITLELEWAIK